MNRFPDSTVNPVERSVPAVPTLGTGAITAPMAVQFREEKLALHASAPAVADAPQDGMPSSGERRDAR